MLVGARFALSVQTGPEAHQAYYALGTKFYPGLKRLEGKALKTHFLTPKLRIGRSIPPPPLVTAQAFQGLFFTVKGYLTDVSL